MSFESLGRDELLAQHELQQRNYAELQAKRLTLDLTAANRPRRSWICPTRC